MSYKAIYPKNLAVVDNRESFSGGVCEPPGSQCQPHNRVHGDIHLARVKLEQQFQSTLDGVEDFQELETRVLALVQSLGFSDYALMQWGLSDAYGDKRQPRPLLTSFPSEVFLQSAIQLRSALAQVDHGHLVSLYHIEGSAGFSANGQWPKKWASYVLITGVGNYGYLIPEGTFGKKGRMALSVVSESMGSDEFRHHVEHQQLALNMLVEAAIGIGRQQFPEQFAARQSEIVISRRPLQLLRTIAERDMTLTQASEVLFISKDTANKHIAAAKQALGVATIAGAVLKAVQEGLIE